MISISADVGGTFTDIILSDEGRKIVLAHKVLSSPGSSAAILEGIQSICATAGVRLSAIDTFVHGFTIATNAWLTRSGARVVLAVTAGFRDCLEIGTQRRPLAYSLKQPSRAALVPRSCIVEVDERVDAFGEPVRVLDEETAVAMARQICAMAPEAVAISFLFSYLNPAHEERLAQAIHAICPDIPVYKSADINPQIQEYPRTNTTAISAYVGPVVRRYIEDLLTQLPRSGLRAPVLLMRSDGGVATAQTACERPASMLLSGPAGGVVAALAISARYGIPDMVTFDMGGTSADFSLISEGRAVTATERIMDGEILRTTSLDISTISAGGGSIGSVDLGGAIRVGPESAGSDPGPACYGKGGTQPTLSDAALIMGVLDGRMALGDGLLLDRELAVKAMVAVIADRLGISAEEAAFGMVAIANAQMAQAIRSFSVEKGFDVRRFALLSFGGAGSMFAPFLMEELNMQEILIPARPGVFSASGLLLSELKYHYQTPFSQALDAIDGAVIQAHMQSLMRQADDAFERDGIPVQKRKYHFSADIRYIGQAHELTVPLGMQAGDDSAITWNPVEAKSRFIALHEQTYGFADATMPCEIVNVRLEAIGLTDKPDTEGSTVPTEPGVPLGRRHLYLGPRWGHCEASIYERQTLGIGQVIHGPAVIAQPDTTILVLPEQRARIDGSLLRIYRAVDEVPESC